MSQVNDSFLARLPEADVLAIEASRAEAAASTPTSTPSESLARIQSNPPPSPSAAARFGPEDQQIVYQSQLTHYHQEQATAAEEALDATQPSYDDFSALPPIVARAEYDSAVADYNADPAVAQLRMIASYEHPQVDVASTEPQQVPADLSSQAQQAVTDIHAMPLPDTADGAGLPVSFFYSTVYPARVVEFNAQRADAAQSALDELRPTPEHLQAMHPTQAQQTLSDFNNDPYVAELERIITEAEANPHEVPAYLRTSATETSPATTAPLTTNEVRDGLQALGIELAEDVTPETLEAGREILAALPDFLTGIAISPGTTVSFETPVGGISSPGFIPVGGSAELTVNGEVALGDVQTGFNFEQTQTFEASVSVQGELTLSGGYSRSTQQRIFNQLEKLSPQAQDLADSSPVLGRILRGRSSPVSGSYTRYEGMQLDYQAIVSPEQGAQLADGDMSALPNPYDPLNMPQGSGVLIEGSTLEGSAFELSAKIKGPVRGLVSGSTNHLDGYGFSVTRQEGSIVEVQAGPLEAVEHDLYFGIGSRNLNIGVGASREYATHDVQIARIDLSTEEGQQAYQAFMSTGHVPDWNPPGVTAAGTTSVYSSQSSVGVEANAGPVSVNWEFGSHDFDARSTQWQDGTRTITNEYVSNDSHTSIVTADLDHQDVPSNVEWTLVLADHNEAPSTLFLRAFNNNLDVGFDANQHVQLSFTSDELMEIGSMARVHYDYNDNTRAELAWLDDNPEMATGLQQALAAAQTPEDVWQALSNPLYAGEIGHRLLSISIDTGEAIPGTLLTQASG